MGKSSVGHMPDGKWEFDEHVTEVFDDMLARSIPQYGTMRSAVNSLASRFVRPRTDVVDLGCSRGEAMAVLIATFRDRCRFIGIDVSEPMLAACRQRFAKEIDSGIVEIRSDDLREGYPPVMASVTLCVFTLQFTPIEHRLRILHDVFQHTCPGGALLVVEKILGADAIINGTLTEEYVQHKIDHGYSMSEIERKKLSLEGVLVPVTARWNEELLKGAGFSHVECFWRWMNFAGWLAIR